MSTSPNGATMRYKVNAWSQFTGWSSWSTDDLDVARGVVAAGSGEVVDNTTGKPIYRVAPAQATLDWAASGGRLALEWYHVAIGEHGLGDSIVPVTA